MKAKHVLIFPTGENLEIKIPYRLNKDDQINPFTFTTDEWIKECKEEDSDFTEKQMHHKYMYWEACSITTVGFVEVYAHDDCVEYSYFLEDFR